MDNTAYRCVVCNARTENGTMTCSLCLATREALKRPKPTVGTRVRFKDSVERYPHVIVEVGETGTVHEVYSGVEDNLPEDAVALIAVRLDIDRGEALDEWENCVQFTANLNDYAEYFSACEEIN